MPDRGSLHDVVSKYSEALCENFALPVAAQPEDQLKGPTQDLLRRVGQFFNLQVESRTETRPEDVEGRPDIGVTVGNLLTGHIELKAPGMGARAERFTGANKKQWDRFRALPNLIYTDGSEWSLYRSGELTLRVRIAQDVTETAAAELDEVAVENLGVLFRDFFYWEPIVPSNAKGLAELLAPLTRLLRDEAHAAAQRDGSALHTLANEWRGLLFPEADDNQFADAYAQTVTYALLLAHFEGAERLTPESAAGTLRERHSLLAQALRMLADPAVADEVGMPLDLLRRVISAVDSARIARRGDPWLYFYENFLAAYDPKLRRARGVYYTPAEVVHAQVRLVERILTDRFGMRDGYAADGVVVLDPAVGTGTYPLAVLDRAAERVRQRLGEGAVGSALTALARRLYGFELLVGPYAVAHLRFAQRLEDSDAELPEGGPQIYLTDTLESPDREPAFRATLFQQRLSEEHQRARRVKSQVPVLVCLGNPPYEREQHDPDEIPMPGTRRKGGWVRYSDDPTGRPILRDFIEPAQQSDAGSHLNNIYNDYVYFWRWALWKVFDANEDSPGGVVSFITASSYLRGPGFVGMRRHMRQTFDELWIIDLEGGSLGSRKTENVFAIRTPVAIAIGIRTGAPDPESPARVLKAKLTGSREEKLSQLDEIQDFEDLEWQECSRAWDAPFYPLEMGEYGSWPLLTDLFPWQHSGAQFKRTWPIAESPDVLRARWASLMEVSPAGRGRLFRETRDRTVNGQYQRLMEAIGRDPSISTESSAGDGPTVARYAFRSFDRQWAFADSRLGDFLRPALWRSHSPRQLFMTSLLTDVLGIGPAALVCTDVPDMHYFSGRGAKDVIPLWRDAAGEIPNVTSGFRERLAAVLGEDITPSDLFSYCYGVLNQRGYVERFWNELELPGPRIPITKSVDLFFRVTEVGRRLIRLHSYGERFAESGDEAGVPQGAARCIVAVTPDQLPTTFSYDDETQTLHVGSGVFAPVEKAVWEYSVSGLQVVKSWLDRRKADGGGLARSPLDAVRPTRWEFTEELLELLWVLEHTIELEPQAKSLFDEVLASDLFSYLELPQPNADERQPPSAEQAAEGAQGVML